MRYRLVILGLSLSSLPAQAQLAESDTARLQVRISLAGNVQQGNVAATAVRSKFDLVVSPTRYWAFKSQNASLYQAFYGLRADNDLFSRNYLYYRPDRRVYPFGIAYVSTNYRRKIDLRYFAGAGLTLRLIRSPENGLRVSAGGVYETSRFMGTTFNEPRYNGASSIALWRATTWLGGWHTLLDGHLRIYYDAYYQPAFSDANNARWQYDVGVDFPVWRGLTVTLLYTATHEQLVVTAIRPDDRLLTMGLAYTLWTGHKP
ncbi:hypothetical protein FAES_2727 [Fibrella aestuarina BUZ 2]|uniref:DUF481 domain-containing protein n=1 Tax=Fibrella aestuarina BUZ 2 TaxID=1166018 RepID=I0K9D3_9BACT|nr:DUF481 domain-containing protein [Fibrella aestuarina]CCH00736.1 hypothetical protein FAES_2727 [Fibrella aestuarina BUZ 2]